MTPPILQLYILFFGLGGLLASRIGFTPGGFLVAGVVLSLYAGATNAILLRAALEQVRRERPGTPTHRLIPAAVERCYEGLAATLVNIVKAAGLASTIALPELVSAANTILAEGAPAGTMMNLLLVAYFLFVLAMLGRPARGKVGCQAAGMARDSRGALGLDALPRRRLRRQPADRGTRDASRHRARQHAGPRAGPAGCLAAVSRGGDDQRLPQRPELRPDVLRRPRAPGRAPVAGIVRDGAALVKATLALTMPVIGFASDQGLALRRQRRERIAGAEATYIVAWLQYFLIILMASATASVIGADEIVGRANRVIATDDRPAFLIATYVYVSAWFLVSGLLVSAAGGALLRNRRGGRRHSRPASDQRGRLNARSPADLPATSARTARKYS